MHRPAYLLQVLFALLTARGLAAEALNPWRGWVTFKDYVRRLDEIPDPGISVQFARRPHAVKLYLLRQVVERAGRLRKRYLCSPAGLLNLLALLALVSASPAASR